MSVEKLEKLAELKEKGFISEEEYQVQKEQLLKDIGKPVKKVRLGSVLGGILGIVAVGVFVSEYSNKNIYNCNDETMLFAQGLINQQFPNLNNSLKLSNPKITSKEQEHLLCEANSNYPELKVMHYTVHKQPDGEVLIRTNLEEDLQFNVLTNFLGAIAETPQKQLETQLLSYQISNDKKIAKVQDILSSDLSEMENMIAPECSVLIPLLWHSFDSKAILTNHFLHQGVLGYQFSLNDKVVTYSFAEKWDFDADKSLGYDATVEIKEASLSKTLQDVEAVEYIVKNICTPFNQQLSKVRNLPIETIINKMSR